MVKICFPQSNPDVSGIDSSTKLTFLVKRRNAHGKIFLIPENDPSVRTEMGVWNL